jgi:membrane protein implicated in regulation of membrane protease activity
LGIKDLSSLVISLSPLKVTNNLKLGAKNMTVSDLERAIVEEEIRPGEPGRVRFQSTWWPATSDQNLTFQPGEAVRVIAIENVTLIVEG